MHARAEKPASVVNAKQLKTLPRGEQSESQSPTCVATTMNLDVVSYKTDKFSRYISMTNVFISWIYQLYEYSQRKNITDGLSKIFAAQSAHGTAVQVMSF